jgi:hypothetical protein
MSWIQNQVFCDGGSAMGHDIAISTKEQERAALLREAAALLSLSENEDRSPGPEEDARIVELVASAQQLEHEISHLTKDKRRGLAHR